MIKIKYTSFLILFATAISLFFACKKTPDKPYITPYNISNTLTISELRALYNGSNIKFTKDISLFATVTMTDNYKTLYIRDKTGAISLKQLTAHGIYAGDSIRINLNGSTLDQSGTSCSLQIDSVDVSDSPTSRVVKLAVGRPTPAITATIAQLLQSVSDATYGSLTGNFFLPLSIYDGQLVQINDVQFSLADKINNTPTYTNYITPSTGAVYYNHNLYDCGALNFINISLYSGTADFQNQPIPFNNSGSIIGAISFYSNALQITPRSFADLNFNQPRCGLQTLNQTFDTTTFGTGATNLLALFPGWTDPRYVGPSIYWEGTSSGSTNFPSASVQGPQYSNDTKNVVWLITPPIQYSPTKNINFQAATTYNTSNINQLSVLVSTDYNGYNLGGISGVQYGTQAHWTDITNSFNITTNGASNAWTFYNASPTYPIGVPISSAVPANYTGTFYVGFRYTGVKANPDSAAGYGINNVVIKN